MSGFDPELLRQDDELLDLLGSRSPDLPDSELGNLLGSMTRYVDSGYVLPAAGVLAGSAVVGAGATLATAPARGAVAHLAGHGALKAATVLVLSAAGVVGGGYLAKDAHVPGLSDIGAAMFGTGAPHTEEPTAWATASATSDAPNEASSTAPATSTSTTSSSSTSTSSSEPSRSSVAAPPTADRPREAPGALPGAGYPDPERPADTVPSVPTLPAGDPVPTPPPAPRPTVAPQPPSPTALPTTVDPTPPAPTPPAPSESTPTPPPLPPVPSTTLPTTPAPTPPPSTSFTTFTTTWSPTVTTTSQPTTTSTTSEPTPTTTEPPEPTPTTTSPSPTAPVEPTECVLPGMGTITVYGTTYCGVIRTVTDPGYPAEPCPYMMPGTQPGTGVNWLPLVDSVNGRTSFACRVPSTSATPVPVLERVVPDKGCADGAVRATKDGAPVCVQLDASRATRPVTGGAGCAPNSWYVAWIPGAFPPLTSHETVKKQRFLWACDAGMPALAQSEVAAETEARTALGSLFMAFDGAAATETVRGDEGQGD